MFKKISLFICFSLLFSGMPSYGAVTINEVDEIAALSNHPEQAQLLILKGAGSEGSYQGYGWCPVCGKDQPESHFPHGTGPHTGPSRDMNNVNYALAAAGIVLLGGILYAGLYGGGI